ncbi:hypothetical protein CEXT_27171 [Caerostris extrusa]|uniref:Uncharacterized protein n=1 Tax=Caerostris extrusa TaxID=172846 RepID=A0AAV4QSY0_CAEEX|nr:hypothetical protein CEXT_27171 [Caerostris extrusa]
MNSIRVEVGGRAVGEELVFRHGWMEVSSSFDGGLLCEGHSLESVQLRECSRTRALPIEMGAISERGTLSYEVESALKSARACSANHLWSGTHSTNGPAILDDSIDTICTRNLNDLMCERYVAYFSYRRQIVHTLTF